MRTAEAHRVAIGDCPGHRVLDRLGERWVSLLLKELAHGPRRSGDLARALPGASRKMLTQTLRGLERDGLVARDVEGAAPSRVEYALTPLGAGLYAAMSVLVDWAAAHVADIDASRAAYDAG